MGISIWQLLIVVAIVVLLFGTKKLRSLGSDLGESVKGFKKAMNDDKDAEFNALNADKKQPADNNSDTANQDKNKE